MSRRSTATALAAMAAVGIGLTTGEMVAGSQSTTTQQTSTTQSSSQSTTTHTESRSDGEASCSVRIVEQVDGHEEVRTDQDTGESCSAHAELHTSRSDVSGTTTADAVLTPSRARAFTRRVIRRHHDSRVRLRRERCRPAQDRSFTCRAQWSGGDATAHARLTITETVDGTGRRWDYEGVIG